MAVAGSGTQNNPFVVHDATELHDTTRSCTPASGDTCYVVLANNITTELSNTSLIYPRASGTTPTLDLDLDGNTITASGGGMFASSNAQRGNPDHIRNGTCVINLNDNIRTAVPMSGHFISEDCRYDFSVTGSAQLVSYLISYSRFFRSRINVDIPIINLSTGFTAFAIMEIYGVNTPTDSDVLYDTDLNVNIGSSGNCGELVLVKGSYSGSETVRNSRIRGELGDFSLENAYYYPAINTRGSFIADSVINFKVPEYTGTGNPDHSRKFVQRSEYYETVSVVNGSLLPSGAYPENTDELLKYISNADMYSMSALNSYGFSVEQAADPLQPDKWLIDKKIPFRKPFPDMVPRINSGSFPIDALYLGDEPVEKVIKNGKILYEN